MKSKLFIALCFLMVFVIVLCACAKNETKDITIQKDGIYSAKIETAKEPKKRLQWKIDSPGQVNISILVNGVSVYQSNDLSGEYQITDNNSEILFRLKNESGKDITSRYQLKYLYIGSVGMMSVTVTKNLTLTPENKQ